MLRVQVRYTVDPNDVEALKKGASKHLAYIPPGLRMEVIARGLGFKTWAAMKVSPLVRQKAELGPAIDFASDKGTTFNPLDFHLAMAEATLLRVAELTPELHLHGIHSGYFTPTGDEALTIRHQYPTSDYFRQASLWREAKFSESRTKLIESDQAGQVLRAMATFAALSPTKTVGAKARSSYGLKHVAEKITFDLGEGVILAPNYVSNVDAIIAAIDAGFPIKHHGQNGPNISVGITAASIRTVEAERDMQRRSA